MSRSYEYVLIRQQVNGTWYDRDIDKRGWNRTLAITFFLLYLSYCVTCFFVFNASRNSYALYLAFATIIFAVYYAVFHYMAASSVIFCDRLRLVHAWHYFLMSLVQISIQACLIKHFVGLDNSMYTAFALVLFFDAVLRIFVAMILLCSDALCSWLPDVSTDASLVHNSSRRN